MKSERSLNCRHHSYGFTQIELMISLAVMSIFFLALVMGFGPMGKSLVLNRAKTLAMNISQEQVEKLKSVSYYRLLVSPSPKAHSSLPILYDDTYYPPETIVAGNITFFRFTVVQIAQEVSGDIQLLSPSVPDTGLKMITVSTVWGAGLGVDYVQVKNILSNTNIIPTDSKFDGTVVDAGTGLPIEGVTITVAENAGWIDTTDSNGQYELSVYAGSYNIVATANGYFSESVIKSITDLQTITQNFSLTPMSTGMITGSVWMNTGPVISQVVGSSICATSGFNQEYIELFNPTTNFYTMSVMGNPVIDVIYQSENDIASRVVSLDYYVESIPPLGYYLIANTTTLTVCGSTVAVDASFASSDPQYPDIIKSPDAGGFGIAPTGTQDWIDRFGWDRNSGAKQAPIFESEGLDENVGLEQGEQYIRRCSTTAPYINDAYGNCYDSENNNVDFIRSGSGGGIMQYCPKNSSDTASILVAGKPVAGAAITLNDGLSAGATSYLVGSPPHAMFQVLSIATGTWTAIASGNQYLIQISTVQITYDGQSIIIPNAATNPPWTTYLGTPYPRVFLTEPAEQGYVSGRVVDATNNIITTPSLIKVTDGFNDVTTDSQGRYLLQTSTGVFTITANPDRQNPYYITTSSAHVVVELGEIKSGVDFHLAEGGAIYGFCTRDSINPLPHVLFIAEGSNGSAAAQAISESDGYFTLVNLSTGSYVIYPILDSGEIASPESTGSILNIAGETLFCSSFTITGAFGQV
ncbi:MAG: hypothetical protein GF384_07630, partial [Elusimicrobia bacterium]|nr:hypothetical protein [Elusimicrobiota bacterium]MBD3412521.1 hypothetical protein [Elusimicrobiota bacterium]